MRPLTQKDIAILEASESFDNQDIKLGCQENLLMVDSLLFLQTHLIKGGYKFPEFKNRISTLASKTILNCTSILQLLTGQNIDSKLVGIKFHLIDIPSLFTLIRSQLETYLMLEFIYCLPANDEESEFRYNNWILSGLLSRKEFSVITEHGKEKKKSDLIEINQFSSKIKKSKFFNNYTEKQKNKILESGDPRLFNGWNKIMIDAKIHPNQSKKIYRLLSAHTHSTGLGIINLDGGNFRYNITHAQGHLSLIFSKLLLARFISKFKDLFEETHPVYNDLDKKLIDKIEFYSTILTQDPEISA